MSKYKIYNHDTKIYLDYDKIFKSKQTAIYYLIKKIKSKYIGHIVKIKADIWKSNKFNEYEIIEEK